jgi:hypothetical protein
LWKAHICPHFSTVEPATLRAGDGISARFSLPFSVRFYVLYLKIAAEVGAENGESLGWGPRLSLYCWKGGEVQVQMATRWPDQVTAWAKAVGFVLVVVVKILRLIHDKF